MGKKAPIESIVRHYRTTVLGGISTLVEFNQNLEGYNFRDYSIFKRKLDRTQVREYSAMELYDKVKGDKFFYISTGGGVVFSGGNTCLYGDFIKEFRCVCGESWYLTLETSLNLDLDTIKDLVDVVDNFIVDVEDVNHLVDKSCEGKDSQNVLDDLKWLVSTVGKKRVSVRMMKSLDFDSANKIDAGKSILKELGVERVYDYENLRAS